MKALSIRADYAADVFLGDKTIEVRSWKTSYRGDFLVCANREKIPGTIPGYAICIAELKNIRPLLISDADAALFEPEDFEKHQMNELYAWEIGHVRIINPLPIKGRLSLFNADVDDKIEIICDLDKEYSDEEQKKIGDRLSAIFPPLVVSPDLQ